MLTTVVTRTVKGNLPVYAGSVHV